MRLRCERRPHLTLAVPRPPSRRTAYGRLPLLVVLNCSRTTSPVRRYSLKKRSKDPRKKGGAFHKTTNAKKEGKQANTDLTLLRLSLLSTVVRFGLSNGSVLTFILYQVSCVQSCGLARGNCTVRDGDRDNPGNSTSPQYPQGDFQRKNALVGITFVMVKRELQGRQPSQVGPKPHAAASL